MKPGDDVAIALVLLAALSAGLAVAFLFLALRRRVRWGHALLVLGVSLIFFAMAWSTREVWW